MADAYTHGSTLDEFLKGEGVLDQFEAQSIKEAIAWQFEQQLKQSKLTRPALAKLMKTSRAQVERLLDPATGNVTIGTLVRAAGVFGKTVSFQLVDAPSAVAYKKKDGTHVRAPKAQPVARKRVAARA